MVNKQVLENDLISFITEETNSLQNEYKRIQRRATQDPGTAGDQGEENWATILKQWLPREYPIVTKGRILGHRGDASPQVDILILHPGYPTKLLDKKLYLSGGVIAAFECKLTLKADHISKVVQTCANIKRVGRRRTGTPYLEMNGSILYGVLAHSHNWSRDPPKACRSLAKKLNDETTTVAQNPREMIDLMCVADLATWAVEKKQDYGFASSTSIGSLTTTYHQFANHSPIGSFLLALFRKLAWEDVKMRSIAEHFSLVLSSHHPTICNSRSDWDPNNVYSSPMLEELIVECKRVRFDNIYGNSGGVWSQWESMSDHLSSSE